MSGVVDGLEDCFDSIAFELLFKTIFLVYYQCLDNWQCGISSGGSFQAFEQLINNLIPILVFS
jgi:hypothetical protein